MKNTGLRQLAKFLNGKLTKDFAWQALIGFPTGTQGYMYGHFDSHGKMSGDEIAYIYPGAKLALIGKFKSNIMIAGQKSKIVQATCKNSMVSLLFDKPEGPKFHLSIGTNNSIGDMPLVPDPYESMTAKMDTSTIPNSGLGLFAVRDIEENEIIAFYNGYHLVGKEEVDLHTINCHNKTKGTEL